MKDGKLSFDEWLEKYAKHCCANYYPKLAWNFCLAQEQRENEELKIKFSEATKTYTDDIDELQKKVDELELEQRDINRLFHKAVVQITELEKKLSEAVEVIKFYARKDLWKELEIKDGQGWEKALIITSHRDQEVIGNTELIGGKRARAFLKRDKDER